MELNERKLAILKAIVEDYIATAEPVGSRTLSRKYIPNLSSATIRNEMSDLEEMGYLLQPHTSAGRIPSESAYRLYVDQLMEQQPLSPEEINQIRQQAWRKDEQMQTIIRQTAYIISELTQYTACLLYTSLHIGVFGRRNSGKSSLVNALTGQHTALVSDVAGTTTDPVYKAMEIHGIGPVLFVDTAGFDDEGELGADVYKRQDEAGGCANQYRPGRGGGS